MGRGSKFSYAFLVFLLSSTGFAATAPASKGPAVTTKSSPLSPIFVSLYDKVNWELGFETQNFDYQEPSDHTISIQGPLYGLNLKFKSDFGYAGTWWLQGETGFLWGNTGYDGYMQNFNDHTLTPSTASSSDSLFGLRATVGDRLISTGGISISPFAGLAYRLWNNQIGGEGSYKREINYTYLPLGVQLSAGNRISYGFSAEYDVFFSGESKAIFENSSLTFRQDKGGGYRLAGRVSYSLDRAVWSLEPYYQRWNIGASNVLSAGRNQAGEIVYLVEPRNTTDELGLRLTSAF